MPKNCCGNPFCDSLDPQTRKLLCENVTITYQKAKQSSTEHGQEQIEIIAEGTLLTFTLLEDGAQSSIEIIKCGDILGTHLFAHSSDYPEYHTLALTDIKKCNIPLKVVETLFQENRDFARMLLQNLSQRHTRNSLHWVMMHSKSGDEKVKFIYELLKSSNVEMTNITQEELAFITGVSRITVARAMKNIFK
jgi:CRP-like cAMP-binding protein